MERRVKLPQGMEARPAFFVPHFAVDANHHTNNVWYIRFALEYLPEGFRLRRLRVSTPNPPGTGTRSIPRPPGGRDVLGGPHRRGRQKLRQPGIQRISGKVKSKEG